MSPETDNLLVNRLNRVFDLNGQKTAIRIGNIEHSYNLLKDESNKIASYILSNKKDENFIGVWGDKSFYSFAAIIGIVKAGKTYVPLNPKFPNNRIKQIIFQAGLKTIISNSDLGFDFGVEELNLDTINRFLGNSYCDVEISNSPQINYFNNPQIYLLFTSGSTGTPKGVSISNNQLVSYLDTVMEFLQVTSNDKLSNTFDLTFDLSIHDIFVTFTQGAMLCVPEENDLISPLNYINKYGITHWFSVPSVLKQLKKLRQFKADGLSGLKYALFCGEPLSLSLIQEFKKSLNHNSKIFNLYGPTEATIAISSYEICDSIKSENDIISIGKINKGNDFKILKDDNLGSETGELLLQGSQVIDSYFNESDTKKHFHFGNENKKWYKTGDIVRVDTEGDLFYLGRRDSQVKLNGFRIELSEVEYTICKLFNFTDCFCFIDESQNRQELVAIVEADFEISSSAIITSLKEYLPYYMLPKFFLFLDKFPLNVNKKKDINLLKETYKLRYGRQ